MTPSEKTLKAVGAAGPQSQTPDSQAAARDFEGTYVGA